LQANHEHQIEPISTCFDCRLSEIDPGSPGCHTLPNGDPGYPDDPAVAICTVAQLTEDEREALENSDYVATECIFFNPRPVGKCSCCGKEIEAHEYTWRLYAHGEYDNLAVCSTACKRNQELKEHIWRWQVEIMRWKACTGQTIDIWRSYCPCCHLELFPFSLRWTVTESGALYCYCPHCEQEVKPKEICQIIRVKKPYRECIKKP
jgi:hypothetical protein